jgi:predicted Zn-dependent protease with MMP-like domain
MRSRQDRFDDIVRDVAEDLDQRLEARGLVVEYAAMDIPVDFGPEWSPEVPLARTVAATKTTPARIIAFRRPIETRARGQASLVALVRAVLASEVSALFAIPPEELDDYGDFGDDDL